jgi:hypothetical protein
MTVFIPTKTLWMVQTSGTTFESSPTSSVSTNCIESTTFLSKRMSVGRNNATSLGLRRGGMKGLDGRNYKHGMLKIRPATKQKLYDHIKEDGAKAGRAVQRTGLCARVAYVQAALQLTCYRRVAALASTEGGASPLTCVNPVARQHHHKRECEQQCSPSPWPKNTRI